MANSRDPDTATWVLFGLFASFWIHADDSMAAMADLFNMSL